MRFAPDHDVPIPYMQRTRDYYLKLGFGNPYRWAHHDEVPFTPLQTPLAGSRLALITTAAPYQPDRGDQGPGAPYNAAAKFYTVYTDSTDSEPDVRISHVGYDRRHTHARDPRTWFPLAGLRAAVKAGRLGALTPRFYGAPTNRSQRITIERDAPELLAHCREDGADVALVVPNCPVCHQTAGLVARHLEANGLPTVIMGAAKDIVEHCGVPRFLFSDFPLGNSAGKPFDAESQTATLELALRLLDAAPAPRTTVQSPQRWSEDASWKLDFDNPDRMTPEEVAEKRREFEAVKAVIASKPDRK